MKLISVPVFQDNYVWILIDNKNQCLIVDPGEASSIIKVIEKNQWDPEAIFLTHHHNDHVNGVTKLLLRFQNIAVYGPEETKNKGTTKIVQDGDSVHFSNRKFFVFSTPGHTLGHICFFSSPFLFCGDTLFSGGCGKIFEGTPHQMYESLQKICQLPDNTIVCCAHEYTLENMKFIIENKFFNDRFIINYYHKVQKLREKNQNTLPAILKNERKINLFLRINDVSVLKELSKKVNLKHPIEYFSWLRSKRDNFRT